MDDPTDTLGQARRAASPRFTRPPVPVRATAIHAAALLLWVVLFTQAFGRGGVLAWSVGLAYIAYDTALLVFVFAATLPLRRGPPPVQAGLARPTLGVIVAARNEAAALPATIAALLGQEPPPETVVIADDGSTDGTAALLGGRYGLVAPPLGGISPSPGPTAPALRWLRLAPGGKPRALNAALAVIDTDLVLTVDADTHLLPGAGLAIRRAFAGDPSLVAATGVLLPVCPPTLRGRMFQWFQSYEYMRNFLSRYAWGRQGALLLISGALGAYRREAVRAVGGFDPDSLVEDYELTHRLYAYAAAHGLVWRADVIGGAHATTEAPAAIAPFLRQRRRWFGGFLQTQLWYRALVGSGRLGPVGTRLLPVKAFDTLQPLYGLAAIAVLLAAVAHGRTDALLPVSGVILGKIALDTAFFLWSLLLYRRWLGGAARLSVPAAIAAALIEPFTFQVLRHGGAALGWVTFLRRERNWAPRRP